MRFPPAYVGLAALLLVYDLLALYSPYFTRTPLQWAGSMAACIATDLVCRRLRLGAWLFPLSGLINGMSLLLLCDSTYVWPYAAVGAVSVLSKYLVRVDGRHVFNPTNFGLMWGVLFLSGWMTMEPARWSLNPAGLLVLMVFGGVVAWLAGRLSVSLSYLAVFTAGAVVRAGLLGVPARITLAPVSGAALHLFAFYMVTDPMTTPTSRVGQAAFGVGVALLDAALRHAEFRFAPLIALLCVSALRPAAGALWGRLRTRG